MDAIHHQLLLILSLLFAVFFLCIISEKLRMSVPVFLVIGGLLISLFPKVPHIAINPEFIFVIFLPPLLFDGAWNTSWSFFWKRRRTISLLAFGLVFFTSIVVAYFSHAMIPNFPLAMGFLLGGIVSPTDAVSAVAVLKGKKVPVRVQTVLEGESMVNDAAGLIVFRFALAAVLTGQFKMQTAALDFFISTGFGICIGLAIAVIIYFLYRIAPDNADIDTCLTLVTPYIMYVAAEYFECSGVMAVVTGGLYLASRSHDFLPYDSRMQANSVWATVRFLLNGFVFILIGLQLPIIIEVLGKREILGYALLYGIAISILVVLVRIAWVFPSVFLPRMLSKKIKLREKNPGWKIAFLISWSGMRGVLSLAAALSLPLMLSDKVTPFPNRNLVLFITFVVILFTLLVQGLTLPYVIKKLDAQEVDIELTKEHQEEAIRKSLYKVSVVFLTKKYGSQSLNGSFYKKLLVKAEIISTVVDKKLEQLDAEDSKNLMHIYHMAMLEVIALQRNELVNMGKNVGYNIELIEKHKLLLDLEESKINIELGISKEVVEEKNELAASDPETLTGLA
ncbi:Na+/H+ antiporter [Pinibacter aurantiacus]|uniref:Na+/H+ antiporter n=1 Tax=Pinibacter aurantiacus TaxID=2851599 RepID=A0A9E2SBS9_9BACT|nr:Na+/H+ antiporter [Pinibacter aurantiacus]MBV4359651.1 Na+/H+ antiporter [Pinibacter aurantiacus]